MLGQQQRQVFVGALIFQLFALVSSPNVLGQGGCGSVCLPLEALDPLPRWSNSIDSELFTDFSADSESVESTPSTSGAPGADLLTTRTCRPLTQVTFTSEFADFKNFREGEESIFNPGGNDAYIVQSAMFVDYFATERFTLSLLATHVKKDQFTRRLGHRQAIGFGDIAAFGRYEVVQPCAHGNGPSIWLGLGVKFPTASIDEPTGSPRLPPAFQVGSGAHDLIPSLSFYENFDGWSLFGSYFARLPLERNRIGYRFGQEHELHVGVRRPLPSFCDRIALLMSLDYLSAFHDSDFGLTLPARVRDGVRVLNTGGEFLSLTPGVSFEFIQDVVIQTRFFLPVYQNWHGERSRDVGQVSPDFSTQVTVSYRH